MEEANREGIYEGNRREVTFSFSALLSKFLVICLINLLGVFQISELMTKGENKKYEGAVEESVKVFPGLVLEVIFYLSLTLYLLWLPFSFHYSEPSCCYLGDLFFRKKSQHISEN